MAMSSPDCSQFMPLGLACGQLGADSLKPASYLNTKLGNHMMICGKKIIATSNANIGT